MASWVGGQRFEAELRKVAGRLSKGGVLRVGFLEGATYPAKSAKALRKVYAIRKVPGPVRGAKSGTPTVPEVAAYNEFGTKRSPPRPFFRNMIAAKRSEWPGGIATQLKATGYDIKLTLERTGLAIAGQLRQSITDLVSPPLAESTIERKGFDKPLIDTSHMINSVDHDVEA